MLTEHFQLPTYLQNYVIYKAFSTNASAINVDKMKERGRGRKEEKENKKLQNE